MPVVHPNAAAIDVGATMHMAVGGAVLDIVVPSGGLAMRVNVYNGKTFERLFSDIELAECFPDDVEEQTCAENAIRLTGCYWGGGGAVARFYLTPASCSDHTR